MRKSATLDRSFAGFAGADANHLLHRSHEYLTVADLARMSRFDHGFDRTVDKRVADDHFDLHLGQEIDHVLGAAIKLGMSFLAPESLHFGDGESGNSDLGERFAHLVELELLTYVFDLLHDPLLESAHRYS